MQNSKIQNTFEGIEGITRGVVKQVKKVTSDVATDVKQSVTGDYGGVGTDEQQQVKALSGQQKKQISNDDRQKATIMRQNIAQINEQIAQVRRKKEQQEQVVEQKTQQKKEEKKFEKKKEDSALMKLIKSQRGTKEGVQRASG